ncbi:MAG: 3-deoxy-manno-octulosonate cytidylyltransferase [Flavobacterium sp. BFFFF2]|nr:MAG: 3-deoxy-manno-octulosonate cytidylyltransferase [Flavobacterium sp. BFFFF2]
MKSIAILPARFASTRFPGKMLQELGGKPLIVQTYLATLRTGLFDEVIVVTDHDDIEEAVVAAGARCFRSTREHESGSDRIAEVIADLEVDVVVNVQGDEPFIDQEALAQLVDVFKKDTKQQIDVASLMRPITDLAAVQNPNNVKVVVDEQQRALYFSRAAIPFQRDSGDVPTYFHHIGVYAYRKEALLQFTTWPVSRLEYIEKLEQLRYLEHGKRIQMVQTQHLGIGVDTPDDLARAQAAWPSSN